MNAFFGCVGMFSLLGVYMVAQYIVTGWALSYLWQWFIVPQFGVGELSIAQAIGISIVVSFLTYSPTEAKDERGTEEKLGALSLLWRLVGLSISLYDGTMRARAIPGGLGSLDSSSPQL